METVYSSWLMKSPPEKRTLRLFRPVSITHCGSAVTSWKTSIMFTVRTANQRRVSHFFATSC